MDWNIDSILQDVRYAGRSFRRAPLAAVTIVVTVGLGLGLVAALYTILNTMIFRVDAVYNPDELFGIERQRSAIAEPATFGYAEYEALLRETEIFTGAFAGTGDVDAWIDGVRREGRLVTGNFFQVLGVSAARGRVFASADDEAGSPPVMVLSHRAWVQHFEADAGVLDRTVRLNGTLVTIIGVMPEDFRGLEFVAAPDFWAPLANADAFRGRSVLEGPGAEGGLTIVGRLRNDLSRDQAVAQLNAWDLQRSAERSAERPASLTLQPRRGTDPRAAGALLSFMPLFFAFGLILLIGCANVANLLLARLVKRQREIGIRLAIGASRLRVVLQLLTENLVLSLAAAVIAFSISRIVLRSVAYWVTTSFPPDIGNLRLAVPAADWRVVLFLIAGAVLSTVLFALTPALRGTRPELTRAIHGDVLGNSRPGRARNALVALQVAGSALLLICAAIFLRSAWSSATIDPGFRTADIVDVAVLSEPQRQSVLDIVSNEPSVAATASVWPGALGGLPAYADGATGRSLIRYQLVSSEYFDILEIDLVGGRPFNDGERNLNAAVAVVSESTARELWPGASPLGQVLRVEPDLTIFGPAPDSATDSEQPDNPLLRPRTAVVIGVARDVPGFDIFGTRIGGAGVYMPVSADVAGTSLIARVRGGADLARRTLIDQLAQIDPNMAELSTLEAMARASTYLFGIAFWLTLVLGALALLLTLSGLFSVLTYLVEQRRREIGVRMALGATNRRISALVLSQSARPVGIGLLLGGGLTVGLAALLLATPLAEQIASSVRLFDPLAYAASLACIIVACAGAALLPALRAGRVDPLAALRQD